MTTTTHREEQIAVTLDGGASKDRARTRQDQRRCRHADLRRRAIPFDACDRYGYGDGAYRVTASDGGIAFESLTESEKYGQLRWHGTVRARAGRHARDAARWRRRRREVDTGREV